MYAAEAVWGDGSKREKYPLKMIKIFMVMEICSKFWYPTLM
jgi:hypothetical protein